MRKKICIIIPNLGCGGAERVAFYLLNYLDLDKFDINLITVYKDEGIYSEYLREEVNHISLKKNNIRYSLFEIYRNLKKIKPDIVLVFSFELMILIGMFIIPLFKNIKFINRQINLVSKINLGKIKKILFKKFINRYDIIISQSKDMTEDLLNFVKIKEKKIIEINNPIDLKKIEELSLQNISIEFKKQHKNILCVGRLVKQKGFDKIIEIMALIKEDNVKLYILGEGPERKKLEKQIKNNMLENRVFLLGQKKNPYVYMKNADLFVLSSNYEGFPNVLIESNACGTYAVCNDILGGVKEIIKENINGSIIDFNKKEVVKRRILEFFNKDISNKEFIKREVMKYELSKILKKYEILLDN